MRKLITILALALTMFSVQAYAAGPQDSDAINRKIYDKTASQLSKKASLPLPELVVEVAKSFLGTPYVGGTLEVEPESLQVFLDKTDCILFVELSTCMALTIKGLKIVQAGDGKYESMSIKPSVVKEKPSYELLCHNIRNMRYRLGVVNGYASRIHYTSEWILQNHTNGLLHEFSDELGEEFTQHFSFMSNHPQYYKQMQGDESQAVKVKIVEQHLEALQPYYYVSQDRLKDPKVMSQIKSGDIITFISKQEGLDLAHVAIAYEYKGEMHFIHASSKAMKVIIEPKTLAEYAKNGLRVSRLVSL